MTLPLRVEPIAGALGAEIHGVDIARDLDDATIAAIRQALLDHCVIFFRDQELDGASNATKLKDDAQWRETANLHPVVRTHPETHRKALYVNRQSTIAFENMTEPESRPLLDYLCQHAHRPEKELLARFEIRTSGRRVAERPAPRSR